MAEPVSANGVRTGMVRSTGAVTTGLWLPVALVVPPGSCRPPASMSLTAAVNDPASGTTVGSTTFWKLAKVISNPRSSNVPVCQNGRTFETTAEGTAASTAALIASAL